MDEKEIREFLEECFKLRAERQKKAERRIELWLMTATSDIEIRKG